MTLLITCGVAQEWCEFAQSRLRSMGVNSPAASKQSNLTIDELLDGASKSAGVGSLESAVQAGGIGLGRTWEIATADFFISNARSDNWGWADPRNILFLGAWREFEPNAKFLLLYGSVAQFLATEIEDRPEAKIDVEERVNYWIAYQRRMLDFYHQNREVSTLLHLDFLGGSGDRAADAVAEKLGVQLNRLNDHAELELSKLTDIAATHLVSRVEGHAGVYEELEGSADSLLDASSINDAEYTDSILQELRGLASAERALNDVSQRNAELEQKLEQAVRHLDEAKQSEANLAASLDRVKKAATRSELVEEVDALQSQLSQTQSELEYYFSKYQEVKNSEPVSEARPVETPEIDGSDVAIDFRSFVEASGMYYPEPQGRWAGPLVQSDIQMKDLKPGNYDLSIRIVDAMSTDLLYGTRLLFNGREISSGVKIFADTGGRLAPLRRLKARIQRHPKPFPAEIRGQLTPEHFENHQLAQVLSIVSPGVATPSSAGGEDNRKLSVCVQSLVLSASR